MRQRGLRTHSNSTDSRVAHPLLWYASMRPVALAVAVSVTLLSGCNHTGGFGRAASGVARATEHAAAGFGRVAAPIATRIARVAPVVARDAFVVAAVAAQLSTAGAPVYEAGAPANEAGAPAGAWSPAITNAHAGGSTDPCSDCPSDETCFYVDYVCPATTGPVPIDP